MATIIADYSFIFKTKTLGEASEVDSSDLPLHFNFLTIQVHVSLLIFLIKAIS